MTQRQFDAAFHSFAARRPFRPFLIEFTSGNFLNVGHPEAVRYETQFYVLRRPDQGFDVFAAESVSRVRDVPGSNS